MGNALDGLKGERRTQPEIEVLEGASNGDSRERLVTAGHEEQPLLVDHIPLPLRVPARGRAHSETGQRCADKGEIHSADGDRVYGGRRGDTIRGTRLYGGPGNDNLFGLDSEESGQTGPNVLFGGTGKDVLEGHRGGRLYGGPGNDLLTDELGSGGSDLLVGGPGRDIVKLIDDQRTDVVRLRNGGADHVICSTSATDDVLFVGRTDRLSPSCENATVLFTERPR